MRYLIYKNDTLLCDNQTAGKEYWNATLSQAINQAGTLKFTTMRNASFLPESMLGYTISVKLSNGTIIWSGRPVDMTVNPNGSMTVTCEGMLAWLDDTQHDLLGPVGSVSHYAGLLVNRYNSRVSTDRTIDVVSVDGYTGQSMNWTTSTGETVLEALSTNIVKNLDGVVRFFENAASERVLSIRPRSSLLSDYALTTVSLDGDTNIVSASVKYDYSDAVTHVRPLGKKDQYGARTNISSVNNGSTILENPTCSGASFYRLETKIFNDEDSPAGLLAAAQKYLASKVGKRIVTVKAPDLYMISSSVQNTIIPGDLIHTKHDACGIDDDLMISSFTIDLVNPAKSSFVLGSEQADTKGAIGRALSKGANASRYDSASFDYSKTGTSGIWFYRKWPDGVSECWGEQERTDISLPADGNASATFGGISYPSGLFSSSPVCTCNIESSYALYQYNKGFGTASACPKWGVHRIGSAVSSGVVIRAKIHAIGRWKS